MVLRERGPVKRGPPEKDLSEGELSPWPLNCEHCAKEPRTT